MSKKKVYASCQLADQEVRLVILEIFEGRFNVLRVERVACSGIQNQKIVDEGAVVQAIRKATTNATAALGYRIERVILNVPSIDVHRANQKVHVQVEDGTKHIRLFHVQQGLNRAIQKKMNDDVELVNVDRIRYIIDGRETDKMPVSQDIDAFDMNVDLLYADKETIYSYARCVEQANLEIMDCFLDSYSIAQESAVQVKSEDRPMIQLDLDQQHCTLALFVDGRMYSCATLEEGYLSFIKEIQEKHALDDETCFRLLQNVFNTSVDPDADKTIYIEQREDSRVEITAYELTTTVIDNMKAWIKKINETCEPILNQGKANYLLTGKGANISILNDLLDQFNSDASIYQPVHIGARDASYVCCLGSFYAYNDINKIRRSDKISVNNNELGASIEAINQKPSRQGDGGFTKKLKSVILTEEE